MNAVEIEEAVSALAAAPFEAGEFPFAFLAAFGHKAVALQRLRAGSGATSDVAGAVLVRNNIHLATCAPGHTGATLAALRASPRSASNRVKIILATDGAMVEAEDMAGGETLACSLPELADHFGFFLGLAGITTVRQIRESAFDIRATGRLNRLYLQLLKDNPAWGAEARRPDMNHFMARLIFCFFAEDTGIFPAQGGFTHTIANMSAADGSNTAQVIGTLFQAMNTELPARAAALVPRWADAFPYVNGGLFAGNTQAPTFSRSARTYLLHIGGLDWQKINPDIFGSMIQAVADDGERGALGMHYTSVPNILKVLNPLFLDGLRQRLAEAGSTPRTLLNLRRRLARIRVFDPACGSGNFLVIAYKELRALEAEINQRRGEADRRSDIPLTNFRGIELRDFPAEIARLALVIAEFQCDVQHRGRREALKHVLPLDPHNWITCGNALRLDWPSLCPPTGTTTRTRADDLFHTPLDQSQIDFDNDGGETYICGNPPYKGSTWQTAEQKDDLKAVFAGRAKNWKSLDYVAGWFMKAADYGRHTPTVSAFVSTNSICQGQQVAILWPEIFATGHEIAFAHTSFKWANLASHNAGVTVAIIGLAQNPAHPRRLFDSEHGQTTVREADSINAYLVAGPNIVVGKRSAPNPPLAEMSFGNKPVDGGHLLLSHGEVEHLGLAAAQRARLIRRFYGSAEFIQGLGRYCLWIKDADLAEARTIAPVRQRIEAVRAKRLASRDAGANAMASRAHQMREMYEAENATIVVPGVSSESRSYLPVGYLPAGAIVSNLAFALYDAPLWNMALIASRLHLVWIATVCGKLKTDFRYSNTLGWNTFPVPSLTEQDRVDLTRCAENILLAREAHFPATIAELYAPDAMPPNLRAAHDHNDEVLERIYIGRRFRNDTERLEKLFALYTKMTTTPKSPAR